MVLFVLSMHEDREPAADPPHHSYQLETVHPHTPHTLPTATEQQRLHTIIHSIHHRIHTHVHLQ